MHDLNFEIANKDIFVTMGGSGCGKSTLLRHLIGLQEPSKGSILYGEEDFTATDPDERCAFMRRFGVMYQSGALWSSLTLAESSRWWWK
jgi:phospholipid/cholesterol/gamma-HCH transport system ATP-binding protein